MGQKYAVPQDVTDLTVSGAPTDTQVQHLLDAAYVKVKAKVPTLDARIRASRVAPEAVQLVLVEMVQSVLRNPTGQRSGSENAGPFGKSWSWDVVAASGRLTVTDEHLEMLGETSDAYTVAARDDGLPFVSRPLPTYGEMW